MRIIGNNPAADNAEITAVASGTLPNGKAVIVNADGTVSVVSGVSIPESVPAGSEYVFNSASTLYTSLAFDPNTAGKFVVAYQDGGGSSYGRVVVGTVSGTSISFGSEYVFNSGQTAYVSVAFDPNTAGKFVVSYQNIGNSAYGTSVVGTVSGTAISYGSKAVFNSASTTNISMSFDPNTAGKFVVAYSDIDNTGYGTASIGTVSGTSISFGSEYVFNSDTVYWVSVAFDLNTAGKFVVVYNDANNGQQGTVVVGTVSGTAISYGSKYLFNPALTMHTSVAFDPNTAGKFVVAYLDYGNSSYGTARGATISGTSISFGSESVFNTASTSYTSVSFDPNSVGKFVVSYQDTGNSSYGTARGATISGTSISFGSESVFNAASTSYTSVSFDPNSVGKFVVSYQDTGNSSYGTAIVGQSAVLTLTLTTENFIGFANGAAADGGAARVQIGSSINTAQSSLTAGQQYFVQTDGTIGLTAADPSVIAGTAISATEIIVKG